MGISRLVCRKHGRGRVAESISLSPLREFLLLELDLEGGTGKELARLPSLWFASRFGTCLERHSLRRGDHDYCSPRGNAQKTYMAAVG